MPDGKRILIADDTPFLARILTAALSNGDYQVRFAYDGEAALDAIHEQKPDLMFLDIEMPKLDGLSVCRHIKADPELADIYVIILTAQEEAAARDESLGCGADEFFTKPFSPSRLAQRVRELLG